MSRVSIVTDSTTGLPEELVKEYDIRIVPMGFVLNNKIYRDYVDISVEEFWKMFPKFEEIPTTSAGSLGDFRSTFQNLARDTDSIVCITISDVLSATHKAAEQAAQLVMEEAAGIKIDVIDSKTSSGALGLIVLEAARAAKAGKSRSEVLQVVQDMMSRARYFIIMESLKYIMKVGRAPDSQVPPQALVSPIMGIVKTDTGVMENLGRAANIDEALVQAIDMVQNYIDGKKAVHFLLHYPDRPDKCERMRQAIINKYNCVEMHVGQWPPTVVVATGPMYGLAFYV